MTHLRLNLVLGLVLTFALFNVLAPYSGEAAGATSLTVINPGPAGVILPEIAEFATAVMGDPWDMNEATDLAYYRGSGIANSVFSNGIYSGQMTLGGGAERITLLTAGAPNHTTMRVGKIGYNYSIDAGSYRYLTFRMYSSNGLDFGKCPHLRLESRL
jgi:hypothetical protein